MNKELILKSDLLDIIFDNRNKAYGAYDLRKFYNNRLLRSLGLMLTGVVVLSAFTFLPKKRAEVPKEVFTTTVWTSFPPDKKEEPKKKEKSKPKEQPKAPTQQFNKPIVVQEKDVVKPIKDLIDTAVIANIDNKGKPEVVPIIEPPQDPPSPGGGPATPEAPEKIDPVTPISIAEVMPSYPGGMDALRKFLERNLSDPREMEEDEAVSVKVRFVVNYDGKLQSFVIIEDGGEEFNREVLRVLKKMPVWIPGKTKGQNVSVYYTVPVKFVPAGQ